MLKTHIPSYLTPGLMEAIVCILSTSQPHRQPTLLSQLLSWKCSAASMCGRCEGHCQTTGECQGSLVCFKKGGRDKAVPGCLGIDGSNTDWCTVEESSPDTPIPPTPSPETPTLPIQGSIPLVVPRECSASSMCGRCEGHCQNTGECQGSLVCFKKGGRGKAVPGCLGIDGSNTDW